MSRGAQLVLLGTGDPQLEAFVRSVNRYTHGVGLASAMELAHKYCSIRFLADAFSI